MTPELAIKMLGDPGAIQEVTIIPVVVHFPQRESSVVANEHMLPTDSPSVTWVTARSPVLSPLVSSAPGYWPTYFGGRHWYRATAPSSNNLM
jgi:hypothetical protein